MMGNSLAFPVSYGGITYGRFSLCGRAMGHARNLLVVASISDIGQKVQSGRGAFSSVVLSTICISSCHSAAGEWHPGRG